MKIKLPFFAKYKKRIENKVFQKLDYKIYYEAYKKYVLSVKEDIPERLIFKNIKTPKVSIIIPVYNQYKYTMKCLRSIKENTLMEDYEIILADDCSTDETYEIDNKVSNITVIRNGVNKGFVNNCNMAAKEAKGEYIYFLNNDTQLLKGAIDKLVEVLESDTLIGAVGSKLIYPDGKLQGAGSSISKRGFVSSIGHLNNPLEEKYNVLREVDYCCGASLMIRKSLWDKLEGFDEFFAPGYYEETDLCLRIKKLGYKVIYQPFSEVIHYTSQSFSENSIKIMQNNGKKFRTKWKNRFKH